MCAKLHRQSHGSPGLSSVESKVRERVFICTYSSLRCMCKLGFAQIIWFLSSLDLKQLDLFQSELLKYGC